MVMLMANMAKTVQAEKATFFGWNVHEMGGGKLRATDPKSEFKDWEISYEKGTIKAEFKNLEGYHSWTPWYFARYTVEFKKEGAEWKVDKKLVTTEKEIGQYTPFTNPIVLERDTVYEKELNQLLKTKLGGDWLGERRKEDEAESRTKELKHQAEDRKKIHERLGKPLK